MTASSTTIELQATGVWYYSPGDEDAFFAWLDTLACVERYEGRGRTLYISVNPTAVDERELRELLALFRRYEVGLKQLAVFDRSDFAWFRNERAYWYEGVFGQAKP